MTCEFCGGRTARKRVRKQHWYRRRLYLVENVQAEVCRACGERYFHAGVLDAIDDVLARKHPVKVRLHVEVVCL